MAITDQLAQLTTSLVKVRTAINAKGVGLASGTPLSAWPEAIQAIETSPRWRPPRTWWDIETMVETGILPWLPGPWIWNTRWGMVFNNTAATVNVPAGSYTSDGGFYPEAATHTWDAAQDLNGTRAVIVAGDSRNASVNLRNGCVYAYLGDCHLTYLAAAQNAALRALQIGASTTGASNGFVGSYLTESFYMCYALQAVEFPPGLASVPERVFQECPALASVTFPGSVITCPTHLLCRVQAMPSITFHAAWVLIPNYSFYQSFHVTVILRGPQTQVQSQTFNQHATLQNLIVPPGWQQAAPLLLTESYNLTAASVDGIVQNLTDRTGTTAFILTLHPTAAARVSQATRDLAASKNITLTP